MRLDPSFNRVVAVAALCAPAFAAYVDPGSAGDYEGLLSAGRARRAGHYGRQIVYPAAGSRDDLRAAAMQRLGRREGDLAALIFAIDVIAERWDAEAARSLTSAMDDETLPDAVRGYAVNALGRMTGPYLLLSETYVPDERPIGDRVRAMRERMEAHPLLIDGAQVPLVDHLFRRVEEALLRASTPDREDGDLEQSEASSYGQDYLALGGDERRRASTLMEHLKRIRALPRGEDGVYDGVIQDLQEEILWRLQEYIGPVEGFEEPPGGRVELDGRVDVVLGWWTANNDRGPSEWRMERLAARGYRVKKSADPAVIGAELLRAIRAGTPGEARGASDVLLGLGFDCGTVPLPGRWSPLVGRSEAGVEAAHTLVRGQVSARAAAMMLESGWPAWDGEAWTIRRVEPGESK